MLIAFRLSCLGTGGAERVFISVATALARMHDSAIHFIVDRLGRGELETVVTGLGFGLFGLDCQRTVQSILPFRRYLDAHRPDVVISAYTDTNMAMLLSATLATHRCVRVVTEHASLDEHWQFATRKRKALLNGYVRYGYRLADHVLAVSEGIVTQIDRRLRAPGKVSCIHNPVRFGSAGQPPLPACATRTGPRTILAVGRVARPKNYLHLLRAFRQVAAGRAVQLLIVGEICEPAEKALLDAFIAEHDLSRMVRFTGFTNHVDEYYAAADLFVLSSAWEGFGNVLVEALAFGLPIVSTDCNYGPAEILCHGKYGTLVPLGDVAALAAAMCSALDAPPHDRAVLYQRAQAFSESRIGEQYWNLIQRLAVAR